MWKSRQRPQRIAMSETAFWVVSTVLVLGTILYCTARTERRIDESAARFEDRMVRHFDRMEGRFDQLEARLAEMSQGLENEQRAGGRQGK